MFPPFSIRRGQNPLKSYRCFFLLISHIAFIHGFFVAIRTPRAGLAMEPEWWLALKLTGHCVTSDGQSQVTTDMVVVSAGPSAPNGGVLRFSSSFDQGMPSPVLSGV